MNSMVKRYILFIFIIAGFLTILTIPLSGYGSKPQIGTINLQQINQNVTNNELNASIYNQNNNIQTTATMPNANVSTTITTTFVTTSTITIESTTSCSNLIISSLPPCNTLNNLGKIITITSTANGETSTITTTISGAVTAILNNETGGNQIINSGCLNQTIFSRIVCNSTVIANKLGCYLGISRDCQIAANLQTLSNIGTPTSPSGLLANSLIGRATGTFGTAQYSTNNSFLKILDNPLTQAVTLAFAFVGLGWLAGVLGAGILANIIARVGLTLSFFYYMNAQMAAFGDIPIFITIFVNVIVDVPVLIMLYESFEGGIAG